MEWAKGRNQSLLLLQPTVCERELCVFAFQTLGVMNEAADEIATGAQVLPGTPAVLDFFGLLYSDPGVTSTLLVGQMFESALLKRTGNWYILGIS